MADEMQGIMSLPEQPAMEQAAAPTAEQSAAVEQMRSQLSPSEVNTEMLGAAEEADPATVAEFKAELQGLELPPEVLDMLNTMVEEILDAPQDYEAIRAKYMAQGLEDLLPPEFDATFFGALNMAIDQIRAASPAGQPAMASGVNTVEDIFTYNPAAAAPMAPQGFAQGGIASLGRNGDTMLAHINPQEAALLRSRGGSGSINPRTGLPEFFSLKGVFKKIGSAVKKFASSTIGKIVISAALFMVAGPAAASMLNITAPAAVSAVSGFVAGAGSNLLAGGNLKDSLKLGAKGALTAGALTGVTQGASAFKGVPKADASVGGIPATDAAATTGTATTTPVTGPQLSPTASAVTTQGGPLTQGLGSIPDNISAAKPSDFRFYNDAGVGATAPSSGVISLNTKPAGFTVGDMSASNSTVPLTTVTPTTVTPAPGFFGNMKAALTKDTMGVGGADTGFFEGLNKAFNPNQIKLAGEPYARSQALEAGLAAGPRGSPAFATAYEAALKTAMPGMIQQYVPLVAGGLGIMAATGGFDAEQPEIPAGYEDMAAGVSRGEKLLKEKPEEYGLRFGGVNTTFAPNPYAFMFAPPPPAPIAKREGGIAELRGYRAGGDPSQFPRKNGPISGPGTGTSDDVPAMLSDGEFVFTAKAVRALGDGSRRKGAKRMLALMKKLVGRSNG